MMASRVFSVLAASFLVLAFALGALTPPGLNLGQGITMLDHGTVPWLQAHAASWLFDRVILPLLVRPVWLLPAALGVVSAGAALTLYSGLTPSSRRRRS